MGAVKHQSKQKASNDRGTTQLKEKTESAGMLSGEGTTQLKRQSMVSGSTQVQHVAQLQKVANSATVQRKVQINDSPSLEHEADVMGAKAMSIQRMSTGAVSDAQASAGQVVQRVNFWPFGKKKSTSQVQQPLLQGVDAPTYRTGSGTVVGHMDEEADLGAATDHTSSDLAGKAALVATGVSGGASAMGKTASEIAKLSLSVHHVAPEILAPLAGIGGVASVAGSVIDSATKAKNLRTTAAHSAGIGEQSGDLTASTAAIGTGIGSTTAGIGSALGSKTAMATGGYIAGPLAAVGGAAEIVSGGIGLHSASKGADGLAPLAAPAHGQARSQAQAVAHVAHEAQKVKKVSSALKIGKGILGVVGGGLLLAGMGPVGWGVLAGAGLLSAGSAVYKYYKKSKQGKEALAGQHDAIVDNHALRDHLGRDGLNRFDLIRNARAGDIVKGAAADKLHSSALLAGTKTAVLGHMGLKASATPKEIARNL